MSDQGGRLSIGAVLAEALGFAGHHLETALRLCWVPVLLLLGWQAWGAPPLSAALMDMVATAPAASRGVIGMGAMVVGALVSLIVTATYMAPLVVYAATGTPPTHRSVPNKLGGAEIRWVMGSVLSLSGLFLLAKAPVTAGLSGLRTLSAHAWTAETAVFEDGSLHASTLVPTYSDGVRAFLEGGYVGLPNGLGIQTGAPGIVQAVGVLLFGYVWLRLFPLAAVLTVGSGGRGIARATLAASGGWNLLRLLVIVSLTTLANVALVIILTFVPALVSSALNAAYPFLAGVSAFGTGGVVEPWVRDTLIFISQGVGVVFVLLTTAFGAAVNAGVLGAIVRRVRG